MKLIDMVVTDYLNIVASDAPAPGGGSAAALYLDLRDRRADELPFRQPLWHWPIGVGWHHALH